VGEKLEKHRRKKALVEEKLDFSGKMCYNYAIGVNSNILTRPAQAAERSSFSNGKKK